MKAAKCTLLIAALSFALAPMAIADPSGSEVCRQIAWSPEALTFYGDAKIVSDKLAKLNNDLQDRRMYVFVVESENMAELSVFERTNGQNIALSRWAGNSLGEITNRISHVLLANHGAECAGRLTKELLAHEAAGKASTVNISAPATLHAAFQHAAQQPADNYIRVSVFLLC